MADLASVPTSVCEHCPGDPGQCLRENWRAVEHIDGGFSLRFTCPHVDVALEAAHAGIGPWRVTDLNAAPGGVDLADGRAAPARNVLFHAADVLEQMGYFRPHGRDAIAESMRQAYAAHFGAQCSSAVAR